MPMPEYTVLREQKSSQNANFRDNSGKIVVSFALKIKEY